MVFLGKLDGILVKPCFEQSTMAPSFAQVHESGHELEACVEAANKAKSRQILNLIMVEALLFHSTFKLCSSWEIQLHVETQALKTRN